MKGHIIPGFAWNIIIILCTGHHLVYGQMDMNMWGGLADMVSSAVLDEKPVNITVEVGKTAKLPCPVTNPDGIYVTWFTKDMTEIPIDNKTVTVSMEGYDAFSLVFKKVTYQDQGKYRCMLQSLPPSYKNVTLIINGPPVISRESIRSKYSVKEGSELKISCDTIGQPEPEIKWYFYKDMPSQNEVKELLSSTKELRIARLHRNNEGIIRCEAKNEYGTAMYETYLNVTFKPKITIRPAQMMLKEGDIATAICVVTSNPEANMRWSQIQKKSGSSKYNTYMMPENDQFTKELAININKVTTSDTGLYKCVAINSYGYTEGLLTIIVSSDKTTKPITTTTTTTTTTRQVEETTLSIVTIGNSNSGKPDDLIIDTTGKSEGPRMDPSRDGNSASQLGNHGPIWGLILVLSLVYLIC